MLQYHWMRTTHNHRCGTKCLLLGSRFSVLRSRFVDMIKRYSIAVDRVMFRSTEWYIQQSEMQNHFEAERQ